MFLTGALQQRFQILFEAGPARRHDVRALLGQGIELASGYRQRLTVREASPSMLESRLRLLGAPEECFLISADEAADGKNMLLAEALETIGAGYCASFVSCIPGSLGYFRYEHLKAGYLLRRYVFS